MGTNSLHITNGDSAAHIMATAGIKGVILPWRDILHDGPVPAGLDLDELAGVRAAFLDQPVITGRQEILQSFHDRDQTLQGATGFEAVTLWFEHDLVDQLQILQLLHWFSGADLPHTRLSMLCIDAFPGIEPFYGLGQLDAAQMALAFCLTRPFMMSAIIGATDMDQLKTDIAAADLTLSDEVMADIAKVHRQFPIPM